MAALLEAQALQTGLAEARAAPASGSLRPSRVVCAAAAELRAGGAVWDGALRRLVLPTLPPRRPGDI